MVWFIFIFEHAVDCFFQLWLVWDLIKFLVCMCWWCLLFSAVHFLLAPKMVLAILLALLILCLRFLPQRSWQLWVHVSLNNPKHTSTWKFIVMPRNGLWVQVKRLNPVWFCIFWLGFLEFSFLGYYCFPREINLSDHSLIMSFLVQILICSFMIVTHPQVSGKKKRELTLYRGIYFVWYDNAWMTTLEWRDYTIKICKGEIQLLEKEVGLRSCLLVHPPNRHGSQVVGTQSQLALWIAGIKLHEPGPAAAGSSRQKAEVWLERMHALWGGT